MHKLVLVSLLSITISSLAFGQCTPFKVLSTNSIQLSLLGAEEAEGECCESESECTTASAGQTLWKDAAECEAAKVARIDEAIAAFVAQQLGTEEPEVVAEVAEPVPAEAPAEVVLAEAEPVAEAAPAEVVAKAEVPAPAEAPAEPVVVAEAEPTPEPVVEAAAEPAAEVAVAKPAAEVAEAPMPEPAAEVAAVEAPVEAVPALPGQQIDIGDLAVFIEVREDIEEAEVVVEEEVVEVAVVETPVPTDVVAEMNQKMQSTVELAEQASKHTEAMVVMLSELMGEAERLRAEIKSLREETQKERASLNQARLELKAFTTPAANSCPDAAAATLSVAQSVNTPNQQV